MSTQVVSSVSSSSKDIGTFSTCHVLYAIDSNKVEVATPSDIESKVRQVLDDVNAKIEQKTQR